MRKLLCCLVILVLCFAFSSVNASATFYDTRGTKYEGVVERMARLGIINGMTETTYAPNKGVTRAELAKIITKMNGMAEYAESGIEYKKVFSDVKESDWFYPYVITAADLELVNGYEDGTFKPNQEVTYAEMIVVILRNLGYHNISQDNPDGWYKNYVRKMRELELNDYVGEVNFDKTAKRGDVAIFAWNSLITDKWAISSENTKEGFTYSYANKTPLEFYFEEYSFLNKATIDYIGGLDDQIGIRAGGKYLHTIEKIPIYALGGKISGLYNKEKDELIGVTLDENYEDVEVVSGPEFYLKEQGYDIAKVRKKVSYGNMSDASYVYLVIENEKTIRRAIYIDASKTIIIDSISAKKSGDDEKTVITINEQEYSGQNTVLYKNGFKIDWKEAKKGDVITDLGYGLFVLSNHKVTDVLEGYDLKEDYILLDNDKYYVLDNCACYIYNVEEPTKFSSFSDKRIQQQVGKKVIVTLNIAEEVVIIEFAQTDEDKEKYKIGFVTDVRNGIENSQKIKVDYGNEISRYIEVIQDEKNWVCLGDLIMIDESEDTQQILNKDTSFDNNISLKYEYDAKEIDYPKIGEYIVDDETKYYKVTLKYQNNSIKSIENCKVEKMQLEDIVDLEAYKISFIYDENMKILKVFAVNEVNKFENQIALVKDIKITKDDKGKEFCKISLSVINSAVRGYKIKSDFNNINVGDIITFVFDEKSDEVVKVDEIFRKESIGYKRDLIVSEFNVEKKEVMFLNGEVMTLTEDLYLWNNKKINLNNYRFVEAEVVEREDKWNFKSLKMCNKEELRLEPNDRLAIGELEGVIVIYKGYEKN